jgi:hypothetical protein
VNTTGWLKGLQVTADGTGIVSHAGATLIRALADNIGLTAGLSKALASDRLLVHDRAGCWRTWRARSPTVPR